MSTKKKTKKPVDQRWAGRFPAALAARLDRLLEIRMASPGCYRKVTRSELVREAVARLCETEGVWHEPDCDMGVDCRCDSMKP